MTIDDIYGTLKERGLVASLRRFSRNYLGRAENYAADRGLDRCSAGALLNLYKRLGELGHADLQALAFERLLGAETQDGGVRAVRP
ncbi:MAG: hypothetical protein ICV73_13360 [Acetobacteraceae bacterium]|nr:hypothetical protein [Acetobacteraceae bacterium]